MSTTVVQLQEVVTTATGQQRRVEIGNAVENVSVSTLTQTAPVRTLADVLTARVPGVMVQAGTQTGSGQRIRVRGISSLSLSNEPIFIIDGIRMSSNNGSTSFGNGGNDFSRLGDISPEDIENIEIVKGPSAATLYGTDAANGVVVITTKKGRTGSAHWTTYAEGGMLDDRNWYADNYTLAGINPTTGAKLILSGQCNLVMVSLGTCTKSDGTKGYDSLRVYSPIKDPTTTPLGYGYRNAQGVQVSGGSESIRYFLSGSRDDETGVFKLDQYEKNRYDSLGIAIHPWQMRPNTRLLNAFRGNFSAQVNPQFDVTANFGYNTVNALTSNESNNTVGIGSQAFGGPGYRNNGLISGLPDSLVGYRAGTPGTIWAEKLQQNVNRMIFSLEHELASDELVANAGQLRHGSHRPRRYPAAHERRGLAAHGHLPRRPGVQRADEHHQHLGRPGRHGELQSVALHLAEPQDDGRHPVQQLPSGPEHGRRHDAAAGRRRPRAPARFRARPNPSRFRRRGACSSKKPARFATGCSSPAALRSDQNSAFGTKFQRVYYPKASLSWVVSDEDFFPRAASSARSASFAFGSANGASGVQPGPNDALRTFSASSASIKGTDQALETFNAIGNDSLKPERSTEWETGFDSKLFGNRIQFDVTYYSRLTHDALISARHRAVARLGELDAAREPRLGQERRPRGHARRPAARQAQSRPRLPLQHVAQRQQGGEPRHDAAADRRLELDGRGLSDRRHLGQADHRLERQERRRHPDRRRSHDQIGHDVRQQHRPGHGQGEARVIGVGTFRGYAEPRYLTTFTSGIDLFNRRVRIQNLFDWRGGNRYYNNTERIRCTRPNCNGLFNPAASFEEQAMDVAAIYAPEKTLDGYMQPGAFVKWREATVTLQVPPRFALAGARNSSLVFSGRNLKLWTNYRGSDPESDFTATGGGDAPNEFQTFAAPTLFQFRLNLGY